jgi:hypothetical protein
MPTDDDLEQLRVTLLSAVARIDRMLDRPEPPTRSGGSLVTLERTKAIERVLEESGEVMRPVEIWSALRDAGRNDPKMEVQVTTYDLWQRDRIEKVGRGQYRAATTLHEAMRQVLQAASGRSMHSDKLAETIDAQGLYTKKDEGPVSGWQVRRRANNYKEIFAVKDSIVSLL